MLFTVDRRKNGNKVVLSTFEQITMEFTLLVLDLDPLNLELYLLDANSNFLKFFNNNLMDLS